MGYIIKNTQGLIVTRLTDTGRKKLSESEIYDAMLIMHDEKEKINISKLAIILNCSTRTIHRNMGEELKREKELLNQQL